MDQTQPPASPPPPRRPRRWFRVTFKWCRIAVLLLLLVVILLGLFLNHVGLPDWLNQRVQDQFRSKGWDLKYSRLRLRWYRGIVAEDLQLERTRGRNGPHLFLQTAEFQLDWKAFWHFDLEANSVLLRGGRLVWEFAATNQPRRTLQLVRVAGQLNFLNGDAWDLSFLETDLLGAHVRFRGEITNASYIREWRLPTRPRPPEPSPAGPWNRLLAEAEKLHFTGRPELQVSFTGDAQNWKSFDAQVRFAGEGLESPWLTGTNLALNAHLLPSLNTNDTVRVELRFTTDAMRSPWVAATNVDLTLVTEPSLTHLIPTNTLALLELRQATSPWGRAGRILVELRSSPSPTNTSFNLTHLDVSLEEFKSPWVSGRQARATSTALHPASELFPMALDTLCTAQDPASPYATSRWAQARFRLELPPQSAWRLAETNRPWLERIKNWPFDLTGTASNLIAPHLAVRKSELSLRWHAPRLEWEANVDRPDAGGRFNGAWNTQTRDVQFQLQARAQPDLAAPWVGPNIQPWLSFCTFAAPPRLLVSGRFVLPDWTNASPDRWPELFPSLEASGRFESDAGRCRSIPFLSAQVPFALTNLVWSTPGLSLFRPEGVIEAAGRVDPRRGDFKAGVRTGIDPMALRPAFTDVRAGRVFDMFEFQLPPHLEGELAGNWNDWSTLRGQGRVLLTNFAFRGQSIHSCQARLLYDHRFLSILGPQVLREGEEGHADGVGIDLVHPRLFLTNAVGNIAPRAITKCIGPQTAAALEPYAFERPPAARVEGSIPLGTNDGTEDLKFELAGGPFHWQRFHLDEIKGMIHWRGVYLDLTNVVGRWRGADLNGWAHFDFTPRDTDLFNFMVQADNVDLKVVLKDLEPGRTNKVEGTLNGILHVTSADTHNWNSWQGQGYARMTNGLLWDIPVFGVFSPLLNAFFPGLGNSRARHATATFRIHNSVIQSHDVVIRGNFLRMNYQGTVDFEQRVDGRMDAEILRDMPGLGLLVSKLLWPVTKLFEYRITGTLQQPKTEELNPVSRLLMMPLHPIKTLKDLEEKLQEKPPPATTPKE